MTPVDGIMALLLIHVRSGVPLCWQPVRGLVPLLFEPLLHRDGGSGPEIMCTLGLKASQIHGALKPYGGTGESTPVSKGPTKGLA